jgi:DNA repair protein SbcD/Mre11
MKLLFVGDIHFRVHGSRFRVDNCYQTQFEKLNKILQLGLENKVDLILFSGDFTHTPREGHELVYDIIKVLKDYPIPLYTLTGNHDLVGRNMDSLRTSPLGVLVASGVIKLLEKDILLPDNVILRGVDYFDKHEDSRYQFNAYPYHLKIIASHNMIVPLSSAPFEYVHPDNVQTDAKIVLMGHYHIPFDYTTSNLVRYINPGVPMRWTMDEKDLTPKVVYLLVNFEDEIHTYTTQYLSLDAKSGDEVFNVTKVAELKEKEQTIENFIKTLESTTFLSNNLEESVISFGKAQGIEQEVVENLLKRIKEKRGVRV